jgi:hypothetical protein
MTTDGRSDIAGQYGPRGPRIVCILDEGAITVTSGAFDGYGESQTVYTLQTQLYEHDWVAISNDTAATFTACNGMPLVEKAVDGETLVIGRIIGTPEWEVKPASSAAADTLAKRLAGKYYRKAVVECVAFLSVQKATVMCDGSHACVQGVGSTLKFNITGGYADHVLSFDSVASGGVGVVPLHYVAAGTDGDEYNILVGITGMLTAATGA